MRTVKLKESDITRLVKKVLKEQETENYMFFSNLEQIKRQCEMLLEMDPNMIDEILSNGHDWADDHIAEAKVNMDQVFDFLMNETKKGGDMSSEMDMEDDEDVVEEGRKKTGTKLCARGLASAKAKYDVHPSAYSNGHAVQVCKGKIKGLDGKKWTPELLNAWLTEPQDVAPGTYMMYKQGDAAVRKTIIDYLKTVK